MIDSLFPLLRSLLFAFPPERSHLLSLKALNCASYFFKSQIFSDSVPISVTGISFPNRVGLAAGLDKNAEYLKGLSTLGFGHIEVGTVTPKPQPGSSKPRLFRLPTAHAIINRMGFNNVGIDKLLDNIKKSAYHGILGINIGKNAFTPMENAVDDYCVCLKKAYSAATYITVNVSSPNTELLRSLQFGEALKRLIRALKAEQLKLAVIHSKQVPLFVKIAPDLTEAEIESMADLLRQEKIEGLIATNTTITRPNLIQGLPYAGEKGGLSGAPLSMLALNTLKLFSHYLNEKIPIIASGGIMTCEDAKKRMDAGASLIQLYTGFIYEGPRLIHQIANL